jgi:hypothetical protein
VFVGTLGKAIDHFFLESILFFEYANQGGHLFEFRLEIVFLLDQMIVAGVILLGIIEIVSEEFFVEFVYLKVHSSFQFTQALGFKRCLLICKFLLPFGRCWLFGSGPRFVLL